MLSAPSLVVFSDFDGTITVNETLRKVFLHFLPSLAPQVLAKLDQKKITLRAALIELVSAVPSTQCEAIVAFVRDEPLRPGFDEFVRFLANHHIPLVVVSSGLRFYIEKMLAPWHASISAIHALDVDTAGEFMRLRLTDDHPTDAMPKERILAQYPAATQIAIGDAGSDVLMAKAASIVFARSSLLRVMNDFGKPCFRYEDFYDVKKELEKILKKGDK